MTSKTWAIVAETGLGPILAVVLSLWREGVRSKYGRRPHVFRTLMATRKVVSNEHVNALNLVEVDFYRCAKVEGAWSDYKESYRDTRAMGALEYIHQLSEGTKVLPLWLCGVTQPQQQQQQQQPPGPLSTDQARPASEC